MKWNWPFARARIEELGLRRDFVAMKSGLKMTSFNQYIIGNGRPSVEVLRAMAKVLKCTIADLETPGALTA